MTIAQQENLCSEKQNPNKIEFSETVASGYILDFGGKTYIPFKKSLGTVASAVEYYIFQEVFVRYISKIYVLTIKKLWKKFMGIFKT